MRHCALFEMDYLRKPEEKMLKHFPPVTHIPRLFLCRMLCEAVYYFDDCSVIQDLKAFDILEASDNAVRLEYWEK